MAGKGGEVDIESMEVNRSVRHRLASIEHGQRANRLGPGHQLRYRGVCTGHIRVMRYRNDFDPFIELQRIQVDAAIVGDAVPAQRSAGPAGQLLPRNQVRVMLQLGGDDDITGSDRALEARVAQYVGHQVDGFGGVLGEHQLVGVGAHERGDIGAALLVGVGGLLHQLVRAAMDRAVGCDQNSRSASSTWTGRCDVAPESK